MKNLFLSALVLVGMASCCSPDKTEETVGTDYSEATNWLKFENTPTKEVDMFYILPTIIMQGEDTVAYFSDEDKKLAMYTYNVQAATLESFTNVYAPFYRQVPLNMAVTVESAEDFVRLARTHEGKEDIFAALDYYFEKVNNGRPFILASHSQGTALTRIVLDEYMPKHPDYFSRMIVDYALGFSLPKTWLAENPHVKPATDETSTGVVVGWNLEGPGATEANFLISQSGDDYMINPLSWSTDTAYVPATENHGTLYASVATRVMDLVAPGVADAQIDLKRGAVICTTLDDMLVKAPKFGDKNLHAMDWGAFYVNIRENAIKRAEAFLGHSLNVSSAIAPQYLCLPEPTEEQK